MASNRQRKLKARAKRREEDRRRLQERGASSQAQHVPDPRIISAQLAADFAGPAGISHEAGAWMQVISPLRFGDGRTAMFPGALVTSLYLHQARTHALEAEAERRRWIASLVPDDRDPGLHRVPVEQDATALNAIALYASAVQLAFAALEAFANDQCSADDAPEFVVLTRQNEELRIERESFARRLSTSEKLSVVVPLMPGGVAIKGTAVWERFVHLRRLRDDLVHVKNKGYSSDPAAPSALGRLLRGDGNECVHDAVAVMQASVPGWLPVRTVELLALDSRRG
jgi:hypothetical protein